MSIGLTVFGCVMTVLSMSLVTLAIRRLIKCARNMVLDGSLMNLTLSILIKQKKLISKVSKDFEYFRLTNSLLATPMPVSLAISDSVDTLDTDDVAEDVEKLRKFDDVPKYSPELDQNYSILINKLVADSREGITAVWGDEWHAVYVLLFPGDLIATRLLILEGEYRDALEIGGTVNQLFQRFPNAYSIKVVLCPGTDVTFVNKN